MLANMDNTYGAAFIGMVVAAVLYGISCVQALYYYTNQNDPWHIKLTVTAVLIFDTVHQALIAHTIYTYTITDWGDSAQLRLIVWSLVVEVIFNGLTAFIVQCFLTMRIWRLSGRNIYLTGISMMLATSAFVTLIVYVAKGFKIKSFAELGEIKDLSIAINTLHAAADILIAATLCTLLNISRTGFHRSDLLINRLIVFTVNTGLLTSLCALASLIAILVAGHSFIYVAFFFCLGRLYTNSLLATLNARNMLRDASNEANSMGTRVSLQHFSKCGSNQHQDISINVQTTTQKHHDQKLDERNSPLSYDNEANKVSY